MKNNKKEEEEEILNITHFLRSGELAAAAGFALELASTHLFSAFSPQSYKLNNTKKISTIINHLFRLS